MISVLTLMLAAAPAAPAPVAMTCPVGGGAFTYSAPPRVPPAGERPDGRPIGVAAPPPLPECPDNGLVLYKDYTPAEVKKLEPIVASEAYQALRQDVPYYRAYRLMKLMGLPPQDHLVPLLQASWQAQDNADLRRRYLTEFAEESAKVPARPGDAGWIGMEARAINALRELGRFDDASARLAKLPLATLDVAAPPPGDRSAKANQIRVKRAWLRFFEQMKPVLARKDASSEPFELMPRAVALGRCLDAAAGLDEAQKGFCTREQSAVDAYKAARDQQAAELDTLRKRREDSGR